MPRKSTNLLPRSLEEIRGRRCAIWIRESTKGQLDNFGPDSQLEECRRAILRWGLVDSGSTWKVAASGWKEVWRTEQWSAMLAAAKTGVFDVLVVGYVSRFSRNLRHTLNAVEDHLHPAGVAVLFVDERLLTSDPDQWEHFARECLDAESYSRKLSRNVERGYAAKRRRTGIPGGNRAPYGTDRSGRPSELAVVPEQMAVVERAYDLSAAGLTDREVAAAVGLRLTHVREILTNPFYRGTLRTGEPSALGPLIEPAKWEHVQRLRARYSRRHRGSVRRRQYALSGLLRCGSCGRRLTGHTDRYRHVDACEAFKSAAPARTRAFSRNRDRRLRGESYPTAVYDEVIGAALRHVAASAALMADTVALAVPRAVGQLPPPPSRRIEADRDEAMQRYLRDRDIGRLEETMARLDAEESSRLVEATTPVTADDVRAYLLEPARLWFETGTEGRRAIAEAAFNRIDALGLNVVIHPSAEAERYGWAEAFGPDPIVCSISQSGRGERI